MSTKRFGRSPFNQIVVHEPTPPISMIKQKYNDGCNPPHIPVKDSLATLIAEQTKV